MGSLYSYLSTEVSSTAGVSSVARKNARSNRSAINDTDSNKFVRGRGLNHTQYGVDKTTVYQQQRVNTFVQENRDLLSVIDQSESAKEKLSKTAITSRKDLKKVIGDAAHDGLTGQSKQKISRESLAEETTLASLILLNQGGLKDKINENSGIADLFQSNGRDLKQVTYQKLAQKAEALFEKDNVLHDATFFKNNPNAAVYLFAEPSQISQLQDKDLAQEFKNNVSHSAYQDTFNQAAVNHATQVTNSGSFSAAFFGQYQELATFVAASSLADDRPQAGTLLKENAQWALNNRATGDHFEIDSFLKTLFAKQGDSKLPATFTNDDSFLRKNLGLARLLDQDSSFRNAIGKSQSNSLIRVLSGSSTAPTLSRDVTSLVESRFQNELSPQSISLHV